MEDQERKKELEQNKREKGGGRDFLRSLSPLSLSYNSSAFRTCRWKRERTERGRAGKKNFPCGGAPFTNGICTKNASWTSACLVKASFLDTLYSTSYVGKSLPLLGGAEK